MSVSLHPGTINTDLARHSGTLVQRLGRLAGYDVSYGAISSLYAGTASTAGELNGKVSIPTSIPCHQFTCFVVSRPLGTGLTSR